MGTVGVPSCIESKEVKEYYDLILAQARVQFRVLSCIPKEFLQAVQTPQVKSGRIYDTSLRLQTARLGTSTDPW